MQFEECYKKCVGLAGCTQFAFTNATRWTARTGCSVYDARPAPAPCTAGACGNWDMYTCPGTSALSCNPPVQPPTPPPPPPAFLFSAALGSSMVLQRNVPARVWGTADNTQSPATIVTVVVTGGGSATAETYTAKVDSDGGWEVRTTLTKNRALLSLSPPLSALTATNPSIGV